MTSVAISSFLFSGGEGNSGMSTFRCGGGSTNASGGSSNRGGQGMLRISNFKHDNSSFGGGVGQSGRSTMKALLGGFSGS